MSGRYLLDTNIVIAFLAGEAAIVEQISQAGEVYLSSITIGELYYGAFKSTRTDENSERVEQLQTRLTILDCDVFTGRIYGQIKNHLRAKGRPLPENDIWIAAIAQQHRLTLVSRDAHFHAVEGLDVTVW